MRKPTPLTTSAITADSGSQRKATFTWKLPAAIHGKRTLVIARSPTGRLRSSKNAPAAIRNAIPTEAQAR